MKRAAAVLVLCVLGCALCAHADGIDPNMIVTDPTCADGKVSPGGGPCPPAITSNIFSITTSENGGGIFEFTNESGQHFDSFIMAIPGDIGTFNCYSDSFHYCGSNFENGVTLIMFANDDIFTWLTPHGTGNNGGVPNQGIFVFNLNGITPEEIGDPEGDTGGWKPNMTIYIAANSNIPPSVPEPASLTLVGIGLAGMVLRRMYKRA